MANTTTYPKEFWNIWRNIKKAHPEYSSKRCMTVAKYAYNKRYAVATEQA